MTYLTDYQPPSDEETLRKLAEIELMYKQIEVWLRQHCASDITREQALFRLSESEMWARECVKDKTLLDPLLPRAKSGSYIIE